MKPKEGDRIQLKYVAQRKSRNYNYCT